MLILATVKDTHEAARRFRLLKQAVDEPDRIRAFARAFGRTIGACPCMPAIPAWR